MGINGLLPVLKSIATTTHVSRYEGKTVAIDGYSWLHKGAYGCSREICENIYTDKYVIYCMQRIAMLRSCGVRPLVVFDGGKLPMKQDEEESRSRGREENLRKAQAFVASGNPSAAYECYQRAVNISPLIAKRFIEALKAENVDFIVAPYEADAQMAFLAQTNRVDIVLTEDSDLLAYGCPTVFFKMDKTGEGQEIRLADLPRNRGLSFAGFSQQMFLEMCILAGCDFAKGLPGIGMKKAHQHIRKYRTFVRAVKSLRFSGASVPRNYEGLVQRAIWTFQHQRVFDPSTRRVVHLQPIPEGGLVPIAGVRDLDFEHDRELAFLGPPLDNDLAAGIAAGHLDPFSFEPFPVEQPPAPAPGLKPRGLQPIPEPRAAVKGPWAALFRGKQKQGTTPRHTCPGSSQTTDEPSTSGLEHSQEENAGPHSMPSSGGLLPSKFRPLIAGFGSGSQGSGGCSSLGSQCLQLSTTPGEADPGPSDPGNVPLCAPGQTSPLASRDVAFTNTQENAEMQLPPGTSDKQAMPVTTAHASTTPAACNAEYYAVLSPDETPNSHGPSARKAVEQRLRTPLSPIGNRPTDARPKRKISSFFLPKAKKLCLSPVKSPSPPEITVGRQPVGNLEFRAKLVTEGIGNAANTRGDAIEAEERGDRAGLLTHLPRVTKAAAAAIEKVAAKCGIPSTQAAAQASLQQPFKAPRRSAEGATDAPEPSSKNRKGGGRFGRFACGGR